MKYSLHLRTVSHKYLQKADEIMIEYRDRVAKELNLDLIVHTNQEAIDKGIGPQSGRLVCCKALKTEGLQQVVKKYGFDGLIVGVRRDEEGSRSKERVFSERNKDYEWDYSNQPPELWDQFKTDFPKGNHIRVHPLLQWSELDIWEYIKRENIDIVPLYFAKERPVIERDGNLIMVDDDRLKLRPGEKIEYKSVRFRTLGCYPLTGATESTATTLDEIIDETLSAVESERTTRVIDNDGGAASMEKRKREGYF